MARDYNVMRWVLSAVAESGRPLGYGDFLAIEPETSLKDELARLDEEGLIESSLQFSPRDGYCMGGKVEGLTAAGREFFRLIENDGVWAVVSETLDAAGVDLSYPLLKEVCEEVVKRYVSSFIPDIPASRRRKA